MKHAIQKLDKCVTAVGLFGYYGQHNFGDDLMCELFTQELLKMGVRVFVYKHKIQTIQDLNLCTVYELSQLCEKCDVIVLGGGGALIPSSTDHTYSKLIAQLLAECKRLSRPILCVSIGGNGVALQKITPESRQRLVTDSQLLILRNPSEAIQFQNDGVDALFQHDVVWTTAQLRRVKTNPGPNADQPHVAVNLYLSDPLRSQMDSLFERIACTTGATRWSFVESHTFGPEWWQAYTPRVSCTRFQCRQFKSVQDGLDCLQSYDAIITNRLHVGVAAMSYGKPCIAFNAVPKTKLCFEHLGLSNLCWDATDLDRLEKLDSLTGLDQLRSSFAMVDLEPVKQNAMRNFDILTDWLKALNRRI